MQGRTLSTTGRIAYLSESGDQVGFEHFVHDHRAGRRSLIAHCEMDAGGLIRDVMIACTDAWNPVLATVQLQLEDRDAAWAQYRFSEKCCSVDGWLPESGAFSRCEQVASAASTFGSHSLVNDGWLLAAFDRLRGTSAEYSLTSVPVCSKLPNGGDGPALFFDDLRFRYLGDTSVDVPAGRFDTRHYQFLFDDWPPIDYWLHGDDYLFVRASWPLLGHAYVLTGMS